MKSAPFDYVRPTAVDDAVRALGSDGRTTAVLAGGQSLLVLLGLRMASVDLLVDIGRIEELKATRDGPESVFIGAATTHSAIEDGEIPDPSNGLMARVASGISYRAVRHHGTVGGSVALADPAADWPPCLMALGAGVVIRGREGTRTELVSDFVQGIYATTLMPGEIIVGFDIPRLPPSARRGFAKVARKSGAFASSIAVMVDVQLGSPTLVLGATSTRPQFLVGTAELLGASPAPTDTELRGAIAADLARVEPDGDAYTLRTHTATVLRAIRDARTR